MSIIRLLETGIYLAVGRHFPTNYTGVAPEDILALDAPIRREESVAIADRLRARFLNPPQTIVCAPARRARETVEMLWGEQGVLNTTLDERLGFWPEADAWRYAFAGVKIGPPREQFERAPALVGLAADQAILALYEGVARTREGGLVWATTHSPIADLVTARLLETIKGAEEPQWLHKPFGSGAFALFHLVGENRTPRALRFVNP